MKATVLSLLLILTLASTAHAQSVACALPPSAGGNALVSVTMTMSACHNELDTNGAPVTITSWAQYLGGVRTLQTFVRDPIADSLGRHYYSRTMTVPAAAGIYVYTVGAIAGTNESVQSNTYTLTVTAFPPGTPGAPTNLRTVKYVPAPNGHGLLAEVTYYHYTLTVTTGAAVAD